MPLFIAIGDAAAGQVVRGKLHDNPVTGENTDVIHSDLARNVAQNRMTVLELDLKHGVGQRLLYRTLELNCVFLLHKQSSFSRKRQRLSILQYVRTYRNIFVMAPQLRGTCYILNVNADEFERGLYISPPCKEHQAPWASVVRITGPSSVMATVFS